jgi:hypothetical protein
MLVPLQLNIAAIGLNALNRQNMGKKVKVSCRYRDLNSQ